VQLRDSINYEFSHDWKKHFRGKSFEELVSDSVEDIPRLRLESDSKRTHTHGHTHKMKLLFSVSKAVHMAAQPAATYSGHRMSFARATLLEEFGDVQIRYDANTHCCSCMHAVRDEFVIL
jgi:hypothetical protein